MKKILLKIFCSSIFFSLFVNRGNSQTTNFIPNGDFEDHVVCPGGMFTVQEGDLTSWYQPVKDCTPDYFNTCATIRASTIPENTMGYQTPSSGNGYIGLWAYLPPNGITYSREFIACQLKSPLEKGKSYCVKMNISLSNNSCWSLSGLGIAFTSFYPQATMPDELLLLKHQQYDAGKQLADTTNWMPIEFDFVATGQENYFILGNFDLRNAKKLSYKPEKIPFWHGAYYYIDQVSLEEKTIIDTVAIVTPPVVDSIALIKNEFHEKYAAAFGNGYVLTRVFFDVDKYDLKPASDLALDSLVMFMKLFPDLKIEICGNTDSTATEPYNQILSQNRAEEVRKYLIKNEISETRMIAHGYASSRPLATNATVEGRARNRRVEFRVLE